MLNKILKALNAITQVILLITAFVSLITAYVVFAPDELPKPFRLVYDYGATLTTPVTVAAETVAEATPAPEAAHEIIPGEGIMLNMSTKIINLVDPTGRKYIRVPLVA